MHKIPRLATALMRKARGGYVDVPTGRGGYVRVDTTPAHAKPDTTPRVAGMPIRTR